jgi:hypothetical protein
MTTLPEIPRSPLIDPKSGTLAREWIRFFDDLRKAIVSSLDDAIGGRLEALESDALFGSGDSGAGSNTDYNDATVRGRLDAIETELMFPFPGADNGGADELSARIALLEENRDDASLDAAFQGDPLSELKELRSRLADVETILTTIDDASARLRVLVNRLAALEEEGLFP